MWWDPLPCSQLWDDDPPLRSVDLLLVLLLVWYVTTSFLHSPSGFFVVHNVNVLPVTFEPRGASVIFAVPGAPPSTSALAVGSRHPTFSTPLQGLQFFLCPSGHQHDRPSIVHGDNPSALPCHVHMTPASLLLDPDPTVTSQPVLCSILPVHRSFS